jgi:hypothetical protein
VVSGDDRWLNVDHIVHIQQHLGNNLFRRFQLGRTTPEQHYPCLLVTTTDRRDRLIFLGITATAEDATTALDAGMKQIVAEHLHTSSDRCNQTDDARVPPF